MNARVINKGDADAAGHMVSYWIEGGPWHYGGGDEIGEDYIPPLAPSEWGEGSDKKNLSNVPGGTYIISITVDANTDVT